MAQSLTFRSADYPRAEILIRRGHCAGPAGTAFPADSGPTNVLLPTNPPAALEVAQENARLFPDDPIAFYNIALACRAQGTSP
ncbi:MAG: hypothetical protein WDM96_00130 [Lacunisphaera sp.]